MNLMDEHVEEYAFGLALTNAERKLGIGVDPEPYYRVNDELLAAEAADECETCHGDGQVFVVGTDLIRVCRDCNGLGTRITT